MTHETVLDEIITLETANIVKEYCNANDLTLDAFLILAIHALEGTEDYAKKNRS